MAEGFRLTPQQARLWTLQQQEAHTPYLAQCIWWLDGTSVRRHAIEAAWLRLIERHETLRTTFRQESEGPVQIPGDAAFRWLRIENGVERLEALTDLCASLRARSADSSSLPPLELALVPLASERYALLVNLPALCADYAGLVSLMQEFAAALAAPAEAPSEPPLQIVDIAEWQYELFELAATRGGQSPWNRRRTDLVVQSLPFELPTPTTSGFAPRVLSAPLPSALTHRLIATATELEIGVDAILLTCWQILAGRLLNTREPVIGVEFNGRSHDQLQDVPGLLARSLPIVSRPDPTQSFRALARQNQTALDDGAAWQDFFTPQHRAAWSGAGWFPLGFAYRQMPSPIRTGKITISQASFFACTDRYHVKLEAVQRSTAIDLDWHYDSSRFQEADLARLSRQLRHVLDQALQQPNQAVDDLTLLTAAEQHELLTSLRGSRTKASDPLLVHQRIAQQAERQPDTIAIVAEDGQLTYAELDDRANRIANALQARGVGPGTQVGLCMDRSRDLIAALLGILKAGAAYVPLDPLVPTARLNLILRDGITLVLTRSGIKETLPANGVSWICVDRDLKPWASRPAPPNRVCGRDLAYVIYTSGTTGRPKGVAIEHDQLTSYVDSVIAALELQPGAKVANVSSIAADLGNTAIFPTLVLGGCLHLIPHDQIADGPALAEYLQRYAIDWLKIVPSHFKALLASASSAAIVPRQRLVFGGEPLDWDLVNQLSALAPGCRLYNHYGPTETTVGVLTTPISAGDADRRSRTVPLGLPLPNTEVYLLDQALRPVPAWVPGEIYIGGAQLARGYLDQPEQTAERFLPNPFSGVAGSRMYRAGDLGRSIPGVGIEFLGRVDSQIKLHGIRVELDEVRLVLNQQDQVDDSLVVVKRDRQGQDLLVAYYLARQPLDPQVLRDYLAERLPREVVPSVFVQLARFPLTLNGKIDRHALPNLTEIQQQPFVAPSTPTEARLADLWRVLLGVGEVGSTHNFFQLGGHSLLATQLIARIRETFQVELPLRVIFEAPTVRSLAQRIDEAPHTQADLLVEEPQPIPRDGALPLSYAQQRLWFLNQLVPESPVYNVATAVQVVGRLQTNVLEQALGAIVQRHEVLRTTIKTVNGMPRPEIVEDLAPEFTVVDLQHLSGSEQAQEVAARLSAAAAQPFDLDRGPLLRVLVLRLAQEDSAVLINMHHIVSDGWSQGILVREIAAYYQAIATHREPDLPRLPIQYLDYAAWQRRFLEGPRLDQQLAYWRRQLADLEPLPLPTDRPRPAVQTLVGASRGLALPSNLARQLEALSADAGCTLFITLLAAFHVLLYRYTGQVDIPVGTPIANRQRGAVEHLIGFFVNTLVLRGNLHPEGTRDPSFRSLLDRERTIALDAYTHQDIPFERLVDDLQIERDPSRHPLFQVMFVLQNARGEAITLPEIQLQPMTLATTTAKFDLTLTILHAEQELYAAAEYNTDLFDGATIDRMLTHFAILLDSIAVEPDRRLSQLDLLSQAEQRQLLIDWNATAYPPIEAVGVHELFAQQAQRQPDAPAIVAAGRSLSYRELDESANRLALRLRLHGVGTECRVALVLDRSPELVIAQLAVLKAGGAFVLLDPTSPDERLAFMLADSGAALVVASRSLRQRLPPTSLPVLWIDDAIRSTALDREPPIADRALTPDHLAYVIYTSGSTGQPKGVQIPHRGLLNLVGWHNRRFQVTSADRATQLAKTGFDASIWEIWPYLAVGAQVQIVDDDVIYAPDELKTWLIDHAITITFLPTPLAEQLFALDWSDAPALRTMLVGGDALRRLPASRLGFELVNNYGPTEVSVVTTSCGVATGHTSQPRVTIGRPIDNLQVYLLDRSLNPVPIGVTGEIYVAGAGLARGYLNAPALTAEKFVPHPFTQRVPEEAGARLYRTGDLARYRVDGQIEFLGRVDRQIKIRGFRLEIGEIESLLNRHAGVREAVVVAVERRGTDDQANDQSMLVAYVVPDAEDSPSDAALRSYLREKLPSFMIPAFFVLLDRLPLTANGKIDYAALPTPAASQSSDSVWIPPADPVQATLAEIWASVLGLSRVNIHDNFFHLGGDSILSIQIVARARQAGILLTPRQVFEHQTIAEQAAAAQQIAQQQRESAPAEGQVRLTPIQRWFFASEQIALHHWNQAVLLDLLEPLAPDLLEQAVAALLLHHDALRLRFVPENGGWSQHYAAPEAAIPFHREDLRQLPPDQHAQTIAALADRYQASLDLSNGPLLQVVHFDCGPQRTDRLLLLAHHLVVDGVSWRILLTDLFEGYTQLRGGAGAVQLPPKTTSYQEWADVLVEYGRAEQVEQTRRWWQRQASAPVEPLPVDDPEGRSRNTFGSEERFTILLDTRQTSALLHEVPAAYNTQVNDVLLAALLQTFTAWTNRSHLWVAMESHGRQPLAEQIDLTRTVGWFTSLFPLLLSDPQSSTLGALLKSVKEQLRSVPLGGLSYGLLAYGEPSPDRSPLAMPTPELSFNYLGQFDQIVRSEMPFRLAPESSGLAHHPQQRRPHLIDLVGSVLGGRLQLTWTYSRHVHRRSTIEALARSYAAELQRLIDHCLSPEAGGCTPSDFPEVALTQDELEALLRQIEAANEPGSGLKKVAWILPLAPSQLGMLLETISAPGPGIHIEQSIREFQGELKVDAFVQAWHDVVQRHPVLRSVFVWNRGEPILQVALPSVTIPVEEADLRAMPPGEQQATLEQYAAEQVRAGFDLGRAPLMRLGIFRTHEQTFQVIWTHHHILLDGWSLPLVAQDLIYAYQQRASGQVPQWERVPTYRSYIRWLQQQDQQRSAAFWKQMLDDFRPPRSAWSRPDRSRPLASRLWVREFSLDANRTTRLRQHLKQHKLTANTLVQGLWAMLLAAYHRQQDVVFGITISGRPPALPGSESIVGLFINTLPVRISIGPEASLWRWLADLQSWNIAAHEHGYVSIGEIHRWSGLPAGQPLFESLLVYENYPPDPGEIADARESIGMRYRGSRGAHTQYALTLLCAPLDGLYFKLVGDASRVGVAWADRIFHDLGLLLDALLEHPDPTLGALQAALPPIEIATDVEPHLTTERERRYVAPRDEYEVRLARLWQDVLAVPQVGMTDNFFELGGHSLLALELMDGIRQQFGRECALSTLIEAGTVEQLAMVLRRQASATAWSPLVRLQPRGAGRPFFCVHPLGGNILCYVDLAQAMGADRPFYGLQAAGLYDETQPATRVEEMAARYVEAVRRVQPSGPYLLGGWSFGSLVAFEMAQQMLAQDQEVSHLVLIDTPLHANDPVADAEQFDLVTMLHPEGTRLPGVEHAAELLRGDSEDTLEILIEQARSAGLIPPDFDIDTARRILRLYQCGNQARLAYRPQPYPGNLTLFVADDQAARATNDPTLGWRKVAQGGVTVYTVPGDHQSLIQEPHVHALAAQLRDYLSQA